MADGDSRGTSLALERVAHSLEADIKRVTGTREVVTQGGVVGRISKISENYVTVEVAEGKNGPVELTVQKQAIGALLPKGTLKSL